MIKNKKLNLVKKTDNILPKERIERREKITQMLKEGIPIKDLMTKTGHCSTVVLTSVYMDCIPDPKLAIVKERENDN